MTDATEKAKPAKKKKDVDALLTEVTSVVAKPKAAKAEAAAAPATAAPAVKAKPAAPKRNLRIRQIRSGICTPVDQKQALVGLGLRRIRHEIVRPDTPSIRGQILKIRHLVEVVDGGERK